MKSLFVSWGAYTEHDIIETLANLSIKTKVVSYCFKDKNEDLFFEKRFIDYLTHEQWDFVFSVNYFPIIASCCLKRGIRYLSWSYDNPLNVNRIEETLFYETNRVFLFDRIQAETYRSKGFDHVYHLPLAVNENRLKNITVSAEDRERLSAQITFVGKLYTSPFPELLKKLDDFEKGYLEAAINAQQILYGAYFLEDMLTDEWMGRINQSLGERKKVTKEQLSYAMSTQITRTERLMILGILSNHYQVKLYSREKNEVLKKVAFMGSASYFKDMPKAFRCAGMNLNITLKISKSGIPLRVMDVLGAGGLLLSNYQPELLDYFIPGEDFIMYESVEDTVDKADFYFRNPELMEKIKRNGTRKVYEQFNYKNQLFKLLHMAGIEE